MKSACKGIENTLKKIKMELNDDNLTFANVILFQQNKKNRIILMITPVFLSLLFSTKS